MKVILIIVWFAVPQMEQPADSANVALRQPVGVATQEFNNLYSCQAEALRLASPYVDAKCVVSSPPPAFTWGHGEFLDRDLAP